MAVCNPSLPRQYNVSGLPPWSFKNWYCAGGMPKELLHPNEVPKKIRNIRFGVMPPEEIHQAAEIEVCNRELYNPADMKPIKHGSLDRRLVLQFWANHVTLPVCL